MCGNNTKLRQVNLSVARLFYSSRTAHAVKSPFIRLHGFKDLNIKPKIVLNGDNLSLRKQRTVKMESYMREHFKLRNAR